MTGVIDIMNYAPLVAPGLSGTEYQFEEFQTIVRTTAEAVQKGGGRFIGAAGYNPFRIDDSLRRIETFVRDHGFRYVYFHPMTFGLAANDRRCYPCTPSAPSSASRSACRSVIPPDRRPVT